MSLTVEDGSLPNAANSYVSVSDTRTFATNRGLALPAVGDEGDLAIERLLTTALDYIEALGSSFQGSKLSADQELQWPRAGVVVDGFAVATNQIPRNLVKAQMRLACYAYTNGGKLTAVSDGRVVTRKRIEGAIDTEFADHGDKAPQPQWPEADALLAPLLASASFGGYGETVRV